ncbi:hypothetical protein [Trinickia diaoshuihuensis]|jgi:hypothetical protein|uniref:hypothetical protein n=1 Tax=Trinickia diaoshuihuensis TaxID=2292265 RepID=UPI000E2274E4|nr:hypothetical protein [Trinickia diaoshuihuensis]
MQIRDTLCPIRRFAAGIDVGPREVRLVIASRARRGRRPVGVDWTGFAPLAPGAVRGVHLVDRAALVEALSALRARMPRRRAMRGMPCAMAIPAAVAGDPTVPANPHLQARIEIAAAAGIALAAVDSEPSAALRALAHAAHCTLRPDARFVALWAGYDGLHGWRVVDDRVQASIRFPGGEHADPESALRALAGAEALDRALVGGDVHLLERAGLALADIGECVGCTVVPFECDSFDSGGGVLARHGDWRRAAGFAVAFGLALSGVSE